MRQALGTVVFFGMIGVTFFRLFLTPFFYYVIRSIVKPTRKSDLVIPQTPGLKWYSKTGRFSSGTRDQGSRVRS
jgi:hypothetical protein